MKAMRCNYIDGEGGLRCVRESNHCGRAHKFKKQVCASPDLLAAANAALGLVAMYEDHPKLPITNALKDTIRKAEGR